MHIDEADENCNGERTFGVVTARGYVVVTESLDDGSLRSITLTGQADEAEHEAARGLVRDRLLKDNKRHECGQCYWRGDDDLQVEGHMERAHANNGQPATREEQNARLIDCGPGAWDDRD